MWRSSGISCVLAALAAACGGIVSSQDRAAREAGAGGSSSQAGAFVNIGAPSLAGSVTSLGGAATVGMANVAGGPALGCSNVVCQPTKGCPPGYVWAQPPGACCEGCVPQAGMVSCPELPCSASTCPLGYVNAALLGGCCGECSPDPLFCNDNSECLLAERTDECCSCPQLINAREYDSDRCWSSSQTPRKVPASCIANNCDECEGCPGYLDANCVNHHCSGPRGLK